MKSVIYFKETRIDPPFEENKPFLQRYALFKGDDLTVFDDLTLHCCECSWSGKTTHSEERPVEMDKFDSKLICPDCGAGLISQKNLDKTIRIPIK